jgi:hypothetical protein
MFACFGKFNNTNDTLEIADKMLEKRARELEQRREKNFKQCKEQIIKGVCSGRTCVVFSGSWSLLHTRSRVGGQLNESHVESLKQSGYHVDIISDNIYSISWDHGVRTRHM